ncbi:MAG: GNAT family N-acetyltransferase [Firmicutes bacterium]|nr:GNAT family N-acetyltransferase [Bacillota bacterium]
MNNLITYHETDDIRKLDRFFMMNELEYSDDHPVETDRIKCWEALDDKGDLAGAVALALRQGEYIIDGIAVDERYRGEDIGSGLMALALGEVGARGGGDVYLVARAPGFFKTLGFEIIGKDEAPQFFECLTCPQFGVTCRPEIMKTEVKI